MYNLIKIIDNHSHLKSLFAIEMCKYDIYTKFKVIYFEGFKTNTTEGADRCENDVVKKSGDKFLKNPKMCNIAIIDNFILEDVKSGRVITVGNHCVQTFLEAGLLANIDLDDFKEIIGMMTPRTPCILCEKNTKKHVHKKCTTLKTKPEDYKVCYNSVKIRPNLNHHILASVYYRQLKDLMPGVSLVNKVGDVLYKFSLNNIDKSTINALNALCNQYEKLLTNKDKLKSLKNNCIINSIYTQRRTPTVKQLAIIDKILDDYDRIKKIDDENKDIKYQKYGYTFK